MSQDDDKPSKTQLKNQMVALQKLGESLTKLSATELAHIPLPPQLLEAIQFSHTLKTHESKRRHMQYIGKIMRNIDVTAIQVTLKKFQATQSKQTEQFHHLEHWCHQLITEGDAALQRILIAHPELDRQQLRQLIRKAQLDQQTEHDTGGSTELFRYLRDHSQGDA